MSRQSEAAAEAAPTKEELKKANETVNDALPKDVQEDITAWLAVNPWYHKDPEMQAVANLRDGKVRNANPKMSTPDVLEEVRKYIVKRFPEEFPGDRLKAAWQDTPIMDHGGLECGCPPPLAGEFSPIGEFYFNPQGAAEFVDGEGGGRGGAGLPLQLTLSERKPSRGNRNDGWWSTKNNQWSS